MGHVGTIFQRFSAYKYENYKSRFDVVPRARASTRADLLTLLRGTNFYVGIFEVSGPVMMHEIRFYRRLP